MFDTHAHLNFEDFEERRRDLIQKCISKDLQILNVGATLETSKKAIEIAKNWDDIFAAVGIHPLYVADEFDLEKLNNLASDNQVKAVGEIGLDKKKPKTMSTQKKRFIKQIDLAEELNLPLIVHSRKAHSETLDILPEKAEGVIHCYSGTLAQAKSYIDKGFLIGLNGLIFKMNLKEVIQQIPLEKIILETDCPYLAPPGWQGQNTPLGVFTVAEKVAELKDISLEKVERVTDQNAKNLFDIRP